MVLFPGIKINLGLQITGKRPDGFHDIVTVFFPLAYSDILEVVPAPVFSFNTSGLNIPGRDEDNLVVQAWKLMYDRYNAGPVAVHLHKVVPPGSGLGGGSADAAGMIRVLNTLFKLEMKEHAMSAVAAQLGSDCAFFTGNKPALASGRGEVLLSIDVSLKGYAVALILPGIAISTAEAYRYCRPAEPAEDLREIIRLPVSEWKERLVNDFEVIPVVPPEIGQIKAALYRAGALYAAMSGSGSAVFGVFEKQVPLENVKASKVIWMEG